MQRRIGTRRRRGLCFIERKLARVPHGHISVSRFYPLDQSWTRIPAWWFDLPVATLEQEDCKTVYLLCEKVSGVTFHVLKVPKSYLLRNLKDLAVAKNGEVIRLHLSARSRDQFVDLRGCGYVKFARFLI